MLSDDPSNGSSIASHEIPNLLSKGTLKTCVESKV